MRGTMRPGGARRRSPDPSPVMRLPPRGPRLAQCARCPSPPSSSTSAATSPCAPAPTAPSSPCCAPRSGLAQWLSSETYAFDPVGADDRVRRRLRQPLPAHGRAAGRHAARVEATVETEPTSSPSTPAAPFTPVAGAARRRPAVPAAEPLLPVGQARGRGRSEIAGGAAPGYAQVEAIRAWIQREHRVPLRHERRRRPTRVDTLDARRRRVPRLRPRRHRRCAAALDIPARMVVGYLHGLEPMDLHAWFEAYVGGRWYTFDATQGEPRGGRVVARLRARRRRRRLHLATTARWRRWRCGSGSRSRRRRGPLPPAPPPLAGPGSTRRSARAPVAAVQRGDLLGQRRHRPDHAARPSGRARRPRGRAGRASGSRGGCR